MSRSHRWPLDENGLWPRLLPDDPDDEPGMIFDWALQVVLLLVAIAAVFLFVASVWAVV